MEADKPRRVNTPQKTPITYLGPNLNAGPLPAFIYFALSAQESLSLPPYSSPATLLASDALRVFSFTIPGHGEGFDKLKAMDYWGESLKKDEYLLEDFFKEVISTLSWLIDEGWIDPQHIAVGGLSRGAFIATHIAARETKIKTLLGFAPLTTLNTLEEFTPLPDNVRLQERLATLKLENLVNHLHHLHHLRFYIGNFDTRVDTDACYHFIRTFARSLHEQRARHCSVELNITPSIGYKGHGTTPHTFEEGTAWLKSHLIGRT